MVDDSIIIDLQNDIAEIQEELGLTPQGVYANIRARLDILESRIGSDFAQATDVENPFFIGNDGVSISTGVGVPIENRLNGSLFLRTDGYLTEGLYTRQNDSWFSIPITAEAQSDSVAADVATLKNDFNGLLARLRAAGVIST